MPDWNSGERRSKRRGLTRRELTDAILARFHQKINKTATCWLWTSTTVRGGYGLVYIGKVGGRVIQHYAHRVAYVAAYGDITGQQDVMHSCDNPGCVNPAHLSLGSHAQNMRDSSARGRTGKTKPALRKVSPQGVIEIRESVESSQSLATRFGVCVGHINRIRRGERRKAA